VYFSCASRDREGGEGQEEVLQVVEQWCQGILGVKCDSRLIDGIHFNCISVKIIGQIERAFKGIEQ
jgi:hypothetical protein